MTKKAEIPRSTQQLPNFPKQPFRASSKGFTKPTRRTSFEARRVFMYGRLCNICLFKTNIAITYDSLLPFCMTFAGFGHTEGKRNGEKKEK